MGLGGLVITGQAEHTLEVEPPPPPPPNFFFDRLFFKATTYPAFFKAIAY